MLSTKLNYQSIYPKNLIKFVGFAGLNATNIISLCE